MKHLKNILKNLFRLPSDNIAINCSSCERGMVCKYLKERGSNGYSTHYIERDVFLNCKHFRKEIESMKDCKF